MNTVIPSSLGANSGRVPPVLLASVISLVAAVFALVGHLVIGLGEAPLVIGTLLVASVAGWLNVSSPRRNPASSLDGN